MQYLSFDLIVGQRGPSGYPLRAECVSVGEAPAVGQPELFSTFDPAAPGVQATLAAVRAGSAPPAEQRALGEQLATAFFPRAIGRLFEQARALAAAQPDHGLRLRLRLAPAELNALPWELLWWPDEAEPLALRHESVVTRYLARAGRVPALEAVRPLRVLALLPRAAGVETAKHRAALEGALAEANAHAVPGQPRLVELTWLTDIVTVDNVRALLASLRPHVLHFSGHGDFSSGQPSLLLTDTSGDPLPVSGTAVAGFFRNSDAIRLVVLNACQGAAADSAQALVGLAPRLADQGVPAVVAMQTNIYDWAAQQFATQFYRTLWCGADAGEVETAVTAGRNALYDDSPDLPLFATPVLFLRAEGNRLWSAAPQPTAAEAPARPDPVTRTGGGGAHAEGPLVVGGDYVYRDKITNQYAGGDIVGGNKTTTTYNPDPLQMQALIAQFGQIQQQIAARPPDPAVDPDELKQNVQRIETEARKGATASPERLGRLLDGLADAAGDIFTATVNTLANPRLGLPEAIRKLAADKQSARARRAPGGGN